ncbi:MAG: HD domain-containing protein [Lachnospiraceae bacterium]|nr:HD domain-containing protein [Lachnospiraceae bacterium]
MRPMTSISSSNLCYLICDTLKLLNPKPIEHGTRMAYMLIKMLEERGGCEEYEIAEYAFLTMLHDIGAYKTDNVDAPDYESEEGIAHCVYGSLFLKTLSPFGERCDILLYHHMPFSKMGRINYRYLDIASYICFLEDVDALIMSDPDPDFSILEAFSKTKYRSESIVLFNKCIKRYDILNKIKTGEYENEVKAYFDENVLFKNEEKDCLMHLIAHLLSFREQARSIMTIMSLCICDELADAMDLSLAEKDKLSYAALVRDVGMMRVATPIKKPRLKMEDDERRAFESHVELSEKLLRKYMRDQTIVDIAIAHHERLNGRGYPYHLKKRDMSVSQCILQIADLLARYMNRYKEKEEDIMDEKTITSILNKRAYDKELDDELVQWVGMKYGRIEERLRLEVKEYMETHANINTKYKFLMKSKIGEKL